MSSGLAVTLNGEHLVTVATDGLDLLDVQVHGDFTSKEFASIYMSGGSHSEGEESTYLIWIDHHPLRPGSEVEVAFIDGAETSQPGKTIDELYPDDESPNRQFQPTEIDFEALASQTRVCERFSFEIVPPKAQSISATTVHGDFSFGFSVLWNSFHPERARVSLSSTTLENIRARENGTYHAEFRISLNECAKIRIDA